MHIFLVSMDDMRRPAGNSENKLKTTFSFYYSKHLDNTNANEYFHATSLYFGWFG